MPSNYWQSQLAPLNQAAGNLTTGLARLPMLRAQGAMMAQRGQLYGQEAQEATARIGLINDQAEGETIKNGNLARMLALSNQIQKLAPLARSDILAGNQNSQNVQDLVGATAGLTGEKPGAVFQTLRDSIVLGRSANGDVAGAADVQNPTSVNNNQVDNATKLQVDAQNNARLAKAPKIVPSGSTLMTPQGQPLGAGGYTLGPGQSRFAPQGNLTSALTPGTSASGDAENDDTGPMGASSALSNVLQQPTAQGQPVPAKPDPTQAEKAQLIKAAILAEGSNNPNNTTNTPATAAQQFDELMAPKANVATGAGAGKMPTINTQADYDALPPGSQYMDSNGQVATKKARK